MSSDNKIIELLVYNCHFSNTPLGLNRKSMNRYNCYQCNQVEEAHGALLLSLLNVWCTNCSVPQFRKMRLNVWFMMFVSINLDILWWCIFLMSENLLFHARLTVLYEWLIIVVFIFVHINMFIFRCILGSSESEYTIELNWYSYTLCTRYSWCKYNWDEIVKVVDIVSQIQLLINFKRLQGWLVSTMIKSTISFTFTCHCKFRSICKLSVLTHFDVSVPLKCDICIYLCTLAPHICVRELGQHWFREWLVAWSAPSHYLNRWWLIVNWPLGTNFSEIRIKIHNFSFMKMNLKVSSAKWRPFCFWEMN